MAVAGAKARVERTDTYEEADAWKHTEEHALWKGHKLVVQDDGHAWVPLESLVRLRWSGTEFEPVAEALLKPHIQYSLLAFAWLDEGFRGLPEGRAALVGVAGGIRFEGLMAIWRGGVREVISTL